MAARRHRLRPVGGPIVEYIQPLSELPLSGNGRAIVSLQCIPEPDESQGVNPEAALNELFRSHRGHALTAVSGSAATAPDHQEPQLLGERFYS